MKKQPHYPAIAGTIFLCLRHTGFLSLFLLSVTVCAQQTTLVTGRILRASNGEPLVGASVIIKGSTRGTITDQFGRYQITINRPVELIGRFIGFQDMVQPALPKGNRSLTIDFRLVSNDMQLRDAIVSANRVDEYLQKVPVAASVISQRDLERRSTYNTLEALNNVPNLITDSWLSSQASFSIRGLSTVFDNVGFESTVALYIDDAYFSRSFAFNSTLMDIERVEVLRGPQGTLFGKNTVGGVVHVISEKPEFANNGQIELNYGNYNFFQARAKVNRELIRNKLAVRLTGAYTRRDGYINDKIPTIEAVNKTDFYGFRGSALYTPTPKTTITLRGYYGKDGDSENTFVYSSKPDNDPVGVAADKGLNTSQNVPNTFTRQQYGTVAKGEFKLGRNTLTSITAFNNSVDTYFGDNDVSSANVSLWGRTQQLQNISQELRIHSPRDEKFSYIGGLYFLNEQVGAIDTFSLQKDFLPVGEAILEKHVPNGELFTSEGYTTNSTIQSRSMAAFVSGSYELTKRLRLTAGLRFTTEQRRLSYWQQISNQFVNGQPLGLIDIYAVNVGEKSTPVERNADNNVLTYDLGLDYRFTPFMMGYAKYVRGFKGAGFNTSVTTDPDGTGLVFKPEFVNNYELGFKLKPSERTRFNTALFYTDYINKQELLDQGTRVRVANAAKTQGWGIETEFSGILKNFRVDVATGYLHLRYIDFPFGTDELGSPVNYAGNQLLKAPNITVSVAPEYTIPITDQFRVFVGMNINHTGKAFNDISNSALVARQAATIVNGRLSLAPRNGKWSVALWGKNLTNTLFIQHGWEYDWGNQIAWSRPRYMGVEVYLNFL
ncbi:TonB-dependent receptor [Fibrella forsythiae]|uniref:TonB-dependent receptor n=1 Tax=Fibrella forsythiae TaxID=2817061 RepID=A0ABS3JKP2_9BACT|nr:TonB-dependent receptor [Fibrella forsythiae]MBO0950562.1 TonB-dependent receptor [Fibrella forsythiae]